MRTYYFNTALDAINTDDKYGHTTSITALDAIITDFRQ